MTRAKVVLVGLLVALAICAPSAGTASASTVRVWGIEGCLHVPGRGGFELGCRVAAFGAGNFARAVITPGGLLAACLWVGVGFAMMADPGCVFLGGARAYATFLDPPALSVKISGGEFIFKSTVLGVKAEIACKNMEAREPAIESDGKTTAGRTTEAALTYTNCTVAKPSGCKVTEPIETQPLESRLVENTAHTKVETLFKPQTGTKFAEVKLTSCLLGVTFSVEGKVLAEGGAEDEIANVHKNEAEEKAGTDEDGEAVERPKLKFGSAGAEYVNDETGGTEIAGLKTAGSATTLSGEAAIEAKFSGAHFKDEENSEEVEVSEEPLDLGIDRE